MIARTDTLNFCAISLNVSPARTRYRTIAAVGRERVAVDVDGAGVFVDAGDGVVFARVLNDDGVDEIGDGDRAAVGTVEDTPAWKNITAAMMIRSRTTAAIIAQTSLGDRSSSPKCGSAR